MIIHHARCDGCNQQIHSIRYKCMQCEEYNLCANCRNFGKHVGTGHKYFIIGDDRSCSECDTVIYVNDRAARLYKCLLCFDYDLCTSCKRYGRHGHHQFLCVEWQGESLTTRRLLPSHSTQRGLFPKKNEQPEAQGGKTALKAVVAIDNEMKKLVACHGCRQCPIKGIRFKCAQCPNFDLCQSCKAKGVHSMHSFYPVKSIMGRKEQKSALYNPWETDRSLVQFGKELGRGSFGTVHRGLWKNNQVAIKSLQKGAMDVQSFLLEAEIMGKLKHSNILSLLAVVTNEEPVLIITELMDEGALSTYLQRNRHALPMPTLIWIMTEVADGMRYLESTNFVHRDLAARNVVVGKGEVAGCALTIKICDFGLTRHLTQAIDSTLVYQSTSDVFPLRWTAPEAMPPKKKFSVKSDVWSFGILLAEIVTFGRIPYPNVHDVDILHHVQSGKIMLCEDLTGCPDYLYRIMKQTWNLKAKSRPTFQDIVPSLQISFQTSTVQTAKNRGFQ